jgi:hypothetical protein
MPTGHAQAKVDPSIACLDAVFANMLLCAGDLDLIEVRAVTGHRQSDANRSERSQFLYVHGAAQAASKIESTTEARRHGVTRRNLSDRKAKSKPKSQAKNTEKSRRARTRKNAQKISSRLEKQEMYSAQCGETRIRR